MAACNKTKTETADTADTEDRYMGLESINDITSNAIMHTCSAESEIPPEVLQKQLHQQRHQQRHQQLKAAGDANFHHHKLINWETHVKK